MSDSGQQSLGSVRLSLGNASDGGRFRTVFSTGSGRSFGAADEQVDVFLRALPGRRRPPS